MIASLPRQCRGFLQTEHTRLRHVVGKFVAKDVLELVVLGDGRVLHGGRGGTQLWDPAELSGEPRDHGPPIAAHGERFVVYSYPMLQLWRDERCTLEIPEPPNHNYSPSVTLTAQHLIFPSRELEVLVFDLETGKELRRLTGHQRDQFDDFPISIAPLEDGRELLTCDGVTFRVFDLESGALLRSGPVPAAIEARRVVPSPRGDLFAFTAVARESWTVGSKEVHLARLDTLEPVAQLTGLEGFARPPLFLAGGELLVTATTDSKLRLFSTADRGCVDTIDMSEAKEDVRPCALPDDRTFLAAGRRGVFYIWEVSWPEPIAAAGQPQLATAEPKPAAARPVVPKPARRGASPKTVGKKPAARSTVRPSLRRTARTSKRSPAKKTADRSREKRPKKRAGTATKKKR